MTVDIETTNTYVMHIPWMCPVCNKRHDMVVAATLTVHTRSSYAVKCMCGWRGWVSTELEAATESRKGWALGKRGCDATNIPG